MNGYLTAFIVLCLASTAAAAGFPASGPGLDPLHFKLEIGGDEVKTVMGRIECSAENGSQYDVAMLDLDGDGELEKKITLGEGRFGGSGERFSAALDFKLDKMEWSVDLYGTRPGSSAGPVYLSYTLVTDGLYLFFINGQASFYASADEAAKGKAVRLGPPFRFKVGSSMRGNRALVNVGLKDANDCTLRVGSRRGPGVEEEEETNIQLELHKDGKMASSLAAEYG